jgi:sigma-B regulation protein RsbU (phosphoserine phosphatase)
MGNEIQTRRERWSAWWRRRSRVAKVTLWMLLAVFVCTIGLMAHVVAWLDVTVITLCGIALTPLLLILLFRWFFERVLWKVRNRLILTYLLMGLAPVVLFGTLMGIATYIMAGQYATDTALSRVNEASQRVRDEAASAAVFGVQAAPELHGAPQGAKVAAVKRGVRAAKPDTVSDAEAGSSKADGIDAMGEEDASPLSLMELRGAVWVPIAAPGMKAVPGPLADGPPPAWLHEALQGLHGFQGIVAAKGRLYLCAEVSAPRNGRTVAVLGSRALTPAEMDVLSKGLGQFTLSAGFSRLAKGKDKDDKDTDGDDDATEGKGTHVKVKGIKALSEDEHFDTVSGSAVKKPKHWYTNPPVYFTTTIQVTEWETGEHVSSMMSVSSRLRLLYRQLFATSLETARVISIVLGAIAAFLALLLVVALLMALSLSRTITRSVAELYKGTRAIDAGHLEHRIPVKRKDQLAALARSFNGMAASVSELLVQQREKERLLNELAIAQEVQTTLFPRSPAFLPGFEVHGTCLPARTVGGDYFDFIFGFGPGMGPDGKSAGHVTLALGDISGKGISAALLMSALHSADRAFSAAVGEQGAAVSPAVLLKLLNAHLFRSTQSARYATLFLATYDPATRRLTYSNGGHLPPLVIAKDGSVRLLEVGGAVVGLIDGLEYEEATVQLEPGDLFVAYTDGLTEPERDGEDFGEQRLMEFVRAKRNEPLTVLAAETLQVVKAWIGEQEQPDDMTVVLARQL